MPLSEHEQRLLEQIEQALYAEDPKFASIYSSTDLRTHHRRRIFRATVIVIVGLAALLAGVMRTIVPLGVAGFVIMLAGLTWAVASWQRMLGRPDSVPDVGAVTAAPVDRSWAPPTVPAAPAALKRRSPARHPHGPKRSWVQRLDDRWQHRHQD